MLYTYLPRVENIWQYQISQHILGISLSKIALLRALHQYETKKEWRYTPLFPILIFSLAEIIQQRR